MRILKGVSSRSLPCGCIAGVYETYGGLIIAVIDATGSRCDNDRHRRGKVVPLDADQIAVDFRSTSSTPR